MRPAPLPAAPLFSRSNISALGAICRSLLDCTVSRGICEEYLDPPARLCYRSHRLARISDLPWSAYPSEWHPWVPENSFALADALHERDA
jgi:hypothetical protein